jgi:hypothetical protein
MVKKMNNKSKKNKIDQQIELVENQIRKNSTCNEKTLLNNLKADKTGLNPKDVEIRLRKCNNIN